MLFLFLLLLLLLLCHIQTVYTIQSKIQSIETDLLIQACCCCFSVVVTIAATVVATIAVVVHGTTIPRYQFYLLLSRIHLAFLGPQNEDRQAWLDLNPSNQEKLGRVFITLQS